jgi:hypothetical protein
MNLLPRLIPRRLQFGLRTLFAAILLVAVCLTLWLAYVAPFKRQRQGLNELQKLSVFVSTHPARPAWLRWFVGKDDFVEVGSIQFSDPGTPSGPYAKGKALDDRVVDALTQLRSIETLWLSEMVITDQQLQRIATIARIHELYLRDTQIGDEGVKSLATVRGLKRLDLNTTLVSDAALETVGQFEQLEYLSLSSPNVKGPGVAHLARLRNLKELQFTGPNVTNDWIAAVASLQNLQWVELHSTSVDERALEHIKRWDKLHSLYLNQNAINVEAIGDLHKHLPHLGRFEVNENRPRNDADRSTPSQ